MQPFQLQCRAHRALRPAPSAVGASRSSSQGARRSVTSSVRRRPCSATRFWTATSRRSSIAHSRCCSKTRSGRSSPRRRDPESRNQRGSPDPLLATSRPRLSVPLLLGTEAGVRSSGGTGAAAFPATSSSSTTGNPGPGRSCTRSAALNSAVEDTITTRRCRTTELPTWRALQGATTAPGCSRT